jgi:hypothetical protein
MNRDDNNPDSWGKTALVALAVLALVGLSAAGTVWLGIF